MKCRNGQKEASEGRDRHRERQRDRQTDTHTERHTDRETNKKRGRETDKKDRDRWAEGLLIEKQTGRQRETDREIKGEIDRETDRTMDRETEKLKDRQTNRQIDSTWQYVVQNESSDASHERSRTQKHPHHLVEDLISCKQNTRR